MSLKLTIFFVLCSYVCISQENKISAQVTDQNNSPISYANVIITNKSDDSELKGTITNDSGHFVIDRIETGTYDLEISFVGYSSYSKEIFIDKVIYLESVVLKELSEKELNAVDVFVN
ncbi:carboxypeptidase-like regulatory domain-containing protein [Formosa sp. L2A11]|uniref:carboxypeptidase-like regulatory domain-containing protein n=1 Tax=Formosa sp. L2A11 TaxID=2686363 RepID=UPI00131E8CBA|nr:carboxypeptidase-like regulatory domain-containing protein [Formosa sp. L2A11]